MSDRSHQFRVELPSDSNPPPSTSFHLLHLVLLLLFLVCLLLLLLFFPIVISSDQCVLLCFVDPILGKSRSRCHSLNQGTWDGRIPHPSPGYTGPLLFFFERTHNYSVDNQRLVPWRLRRVGRSKVRSDSLVRCVPGSNRQIRGKSPTFNHLNHK